jgi:hypothetical protein
VGPYPLYTDSPDAGVLLLLDRAAGGLEDAYRERYGLSPIGQPAEAVVLFSSRAGYDRLLEEAGGPRAGSGHVLGGVVALWREGRELEEVRSTLIHELVHLLNRRAIGPALPPWLDEGLAVDLAQSDIGPGGRLVPGTLAELTRRTPVYVERFGGAASLEHLRQAAARGELPSLAALTAGHDGFAGIDPPHLAYSEAGFLVRYLLAGEHAAPFRGFLAAVAEGGDPGGDGLLRALGSDWAGLEEGFRRWLESQVVPEALDPVRARRRADSIPP